MNEAESKILKEISDAIQVHRKYGNWDHTIVHLVFWVSILASTGAAILLASGFEHKWFVITVTALPALCLMIEKTFGFASRHLLRETTVVELNKLRRALEIEQNISAAEASVQLGKIEERAANHPMPDFHSRPNQRHQAEPKRSG